MRYLQNEFAARPLCQPRDAVKLLYQSAFGCGHLLADEAACAARLADEITQSEADASAPAAEAIGGGLCRLNLKSPAVRALAPRTLARVMRATETRFHKDEARFARSLDELSALTARGGAPFAPPELADYLARYRADGLPMVSHSDRYRAAYRPAYRVALADYAALLPLLGAVQKRLDAAGRAVVALDGDCGAGKTTLAALVADAYGADVIHMDDFFLPFERRTEARRAVPGWNVDYERFAAEALPGLLAGGPFAYRAFDCHTGAYAPRECAGAAVTVVEGSYCHHPALREGYDRLGAVRAFVDADEAEQLRRLARRDPERLARFQSEWIPLEKNYHRAYDIKGGADIALHSTPWEDAQ